MLKQQIWFVKGDVLSTMLARLALQEALGNNMEVVNTFHIGPTTHILLEQSEFNLSLQAEQGMKRPDLAQPFDFEVQL